MTPQEHIDNGALVVVNHSGGKDSQATLIKVLETVPQNQIVVIHASLGEFEWHGALELAEKQAADAGVPFIVARAEKSTSSIRSSASMFEQPRGSLVPERQAPPMHLGPQARSHRQADSGLRQVGRFHHDHFGERHPRPGVLVARQGRGVQAQRAQHHRRPRLVRLGPDPQDEHRRGVRHDQVRAGQEPHPAYAAGNERLSCVFCIMGSKADILNGALARPELFAKVAEVEARTGYTLHMSRKTLTQLVAEAQELAMAA